MNELSASRAFDGVGTIDEQSVPLLRGKISCLQSFHELETLRHKNMGIVSMCLQSSCVTNTGLLHSEAPEFRNACQKSEMQQKM